MRPNCWGTAWALQRQSINGGIVPTGRRPDPLASPLKRPEVALQDRCNYLSAVRGDTVIRREWDIAANGGTESSPRSRRNTPLTARGAPSIPWVAAGAEGCVGELPGSALGHRDARIWPARACQRTAVRAPIAATLRRHSRSQRPGEGPRALNARPSSSLLRGRASSLPRR